MQRASLTKHVIHKHVQFYSRRKASRLGARATRTPRITPLLSCGTCRPLLQRTATSRFYLVSRGNRRWCQCSFSGGKIAIVVQLAKVQSHGFSQICSILLLHLLGLRRLAAVEKTICRPVAVGVAHSNLC